MFSNTEIQEGQFSNHKLDGYGRVFFLLGDYYVGMFKEGKREGKGKFVNAKG